MLFHVPPAPQFLGVVLIPFCEANPVHDLLLPTRKFVDTINAGAVEKFFFAHLTILNLQNNLHGVSIYDKPHTCQTLC